MQEPTVPTTPTVWTIKKMLDGTGDFFALQGHPAADCETRSPHPPCSRPEVQADLTACSLQRAATRTKPSDIPRGPPCAVSMTGRSRTWLGTGEFYLLAFNH